MNPNDTTATPQNTQRTTELLNYFTTIHTQEEFDAYLKQHTEATLSFPAYYQSILTAKTISTATAIERSRLEKHYAYQILNGTKAKPGRDKIICLCIGAQMNLTETKRALEISGNGILYVKNTRDAIIIRAINQKQFNIDQLNIELYQYHLPILS